MKTTIALLTAGVLTLACAACDTAPEPKTEEEKTIYGLGHAISRNLAQFNLNERELELVKQGLTDALIKKQWVEDIDSYGPRFQELAKSRAAALAEVEKQASKAFLEKAAAEKGAVKTDSGLIISEITAGTGDKPAATDTVKVHYHGTLIDGKVFDSSVQRGEPATFGLNQVIRCWTEGLQLMKVGGKSKLICPSDIAYGDSGRPPSIKGGATLVFEVELLEIVEPASPH